MLYDPKKMRWPPVIRPTITWTSRVTSHESRLWLPGREVLRPRWPREGCFNAEGFDGLCHEKRHEKAIGFAKSCKRDVDLHV